MRPLSALRNLFSNPSTVRDIRDLPDRQALAHTYLPALAARGGRILWVGCRRYTSTDYPVLESGGAEVWTTDIDPRAARWGRSGRHQTGDICQADQIFDDLRFDTIVCNGVLGFGVDAPCDQERALTAMAAILKPGGLLLLGWNTDRIADPLDLPALDHFYEPASLGAMPSRVRFDAVTHVYDVLARALR
ncbi:MAG TPA: methyltransferase [Brevundimonas sp.]|nr:methyltransferase [Brevundimonas sp.]